MRSTGAVLSRKLFGRKSEQQDKPRSQRQRGQQRGAPGHGRTRRPGLEERPEDHAPPPEACACVQCGQPYAPNGVEESTLVEIEVIVTAKLNDVDPQAWLADVLARIAELPYTRVHELLPWNWRAARTQTRAA